MEQRALGSLSVSVVGLGCNNFGLRLDQERTTRVVNAALDAGINFFDTADVYGGTRSEEFLGRALGARRSAVIVASKFGIPIDEQRPGGARPEYLLTDANLARAQVLSDYARTRGHSLLELAFSWLRSNRAVSSVIAGATSVEQVTANAAAVSWQLSADDLGAIDRLSEPVR